MGDRSAEQKAAEIQCSINVLGGPAWSTGGGREGRRRWEEGWGTESSVVQKVGCSRPLLRHGAHNTRGWEFMVSGHFHSLGSKQIHVGSYIDHVNEQWSRDNLHSKYDRASIEITLDFYTEITHNFMASFSLADSC